MKNLTYENITIVSQAMLKIAYNFWPCIVLFAGYCVYETWFMNASHRKTRNEVQ